MDDLSVCRCVGLYSALWKNGGSDPDAVWHHIGRTGPGMRQIVGSGGRSTGRGTFGGEFGARHCNQRGLHGVRVYFRSDAALFPNYFGLVITGNGDDTANDLLYKMMRNL